MTTERRVVEVEVERVDAELAADTLWQADPSAVSQEELPDGRVRLRADPLDVVDVAGLPSGATLRVVEVDADAHLDAWRRWATPVRAGRRVVLHPAWLPRSSLGEHDLTVRIDPGRAFGSGSHPSSRLVIAAIEDRLRPGQRVLDVGTGSGVLAIAACLLGAAQAVAIDLDPSAVVATRANAEANGVADRVEVSTRPLAEVPGQFDLVLANIGAAVLRDLSGELSAKVAPGGLLVLAGLLIAQTDDVVTTFVGLREIDRLSEDGWTAPVLQSAS